MGMKMRHALTHRIVDCHKRSLGFHRGLHCLGQTLRIQEQRTDQVARKIQKSLVMSSCDQQTVPLEKRPFVEECNGDSVFEHNFCFTIAGDDFAKSA